MDNNNEIEEKNSTQADVESSSLSEKKNGDSITNNKIFKPYKIKDIAFAVVASVAMLITCLDMPFIASIPVLE